MYFVGFYKLAIKKLYLHAIQIMHINMHKWIVKLVNSYVVLARFTKVLFGK